MTYSDNIYKKLYQDGDFADQIAYGIYAANVVKYIKETQQRHQYVADDQMEAFYTAEEAHIQDYQEIAKAEIQKLSEGITEANADKLLAKVAEKVNGKHPQWVNFGINLLSALAWDVILLMLGLLAIWKIDAVAEVCVKIGKALVLS